MWFVSGGSTSRMLLDLYFHHQNRTKVLVIPLSQPGGGSKKISTTKLHLVELYKQQEEIKVKRQYNQQDDDLLALLGFMISGKVIT
jgi:hypothetical protein